MTQETQKQYSALIKRWNPPTTIVTEDQHVEEGLGEFYTVLQKYDKWLHYTKQGLKENREDFKQQIHRLPSPRKTLEKFKKEHEYKLIGYKQLKEKHENGNS